ncbi:hypothetical protein O3M35_012417 [Rhynocoris fuscipes]|uniref:Uncharacterized protein n=1 Tax=Rhynocoris fuscipes TaxID=488301 RepID=A0AAW1CZM2_9HEMI
MLVPNSKTIFCCYFLHLIQLEKSNFKLIRPIVLPTAQLKVVNFIISKFEINRIIGVAKRTAKSCKFYVHHISRTALVSLKVFHNLLNVTLLNLD